MKASGKRGAVAWLVLALSLAASFLAYQSSLQALHKAAGLRLYNQANHVRNLIASRVKNYEHILVGAKGLFASSVAVDPGEWHSYITNLDLPSNSPGIQGISFVSRVPAARKEAYVRGMRALGHRDFSIKPEGTRPEYFPTTFLEQVEGRTDLVIGYDGFQEPARRQAMITAMESGRPVLTSALTLRVDSGQSRRGGFVMYVPVYGNGLPIRSVEERRAGLRGFIAAYFRMEDLMSHLPTDPPQDISYRIHDGAAGPEAMFVSEPAALRPHPAYSLSLEIPLGGRRWILRAQDGPGFLSGAERRQPRWVLAACLFISLLLSAITWSLLNTRARADALAAAMTSGLRARSEQFRELAQKAELATQAKSEFLAKMSHELRTPLNSVIGFANILLRNKAGRFQEQELTFLGRIQENGQHLLAVINSILDLSKIEAGRVELEWGEVDVALLARETAAQLEGQVRERGLELRLEIPEDAGPIRADAGKLKQVIINLVGNALKFTEKGRVTVRLRCEGTVPAALEVEDTGIGIPADRLESIFEAFRQSDNSISRRFGGSGLGLTISRSLARLMGFNLTVSSRVGEGSVFAIAFAASSAPSLPARPQPNPRTSAPVPLPGEGAPSGLKGCRVLVIDDEADSRLVLRTYLEDLGCLVEEATSGREGLSQARRSPPDLITLDLMMPELSGWDVVKELKSDPRLWTVPVVVVSIVAGETRGTLHGVVDRLDKPVTRDLLYRVIRKSLES